jgi:competence ComEA-like helix-hairpin-helix protein
MPGRALAIAGIAALSAGAYFGLRALRPGESPAVAAAAKCAFPVETSGGVECWDGRARPAGVRAGDRVDGDHVVGRMKPEAIAAYEVAVDPNRADAAELASLPGIGPALAQRIIDERTRGGPFKSPEDLLRVSGIGEKTLAKLRPRLSVAP